MDEQEPIEKPESEELPEKPAEEEYETLNPYAIGWVQSNSRGVIPRG